MDLGINGFGFLPTALLIFFIGLVGLLTQTRKPSRRPRKRSTGSHSPRFDMRTYGTKDTILSESERKFHAVLQSVLPSGLTIQMQVRLADIVRVDKRQPEWQTHFNRIRSKSIDFLLCDARTGPVLAIELDDRSHQRADRQERDRFVEAVLISVQLPLLRVPVQPQYASVGLQKAIQTALSQSAS